MTLPSELPQEAPAGASERDPGVGALDLSDRHALLLYWLRHAALHTRQQRAPVGYRYRLWERRNLHPVLAAL